MNEIRARAADRARQEQRGEDRKRHECRGAIILRYQQRTERVDEAILPFLSEAAFAIDRNFTSPLQDIKIQPRKGREHRPSSTSARQLPAEGRAQGWTARSSSQEQSQK